MSTDLFVALLRLLLVSALYLFLLAIVIALARDLRPRSAAAEAPPRLASRRLRLMVEEAGVNGLPTEFQVDGEAVIGRDPACAVHLPPMFVSSRHARLRYDRGRWWIEDLGSRNKTLLNGEELPAGRARPTGPDDEISVAGIRLRLAEA